jgi:hypothetical protein
MWHCRISMISGGTARQNGAGLDTVEQKEKEGRGRANRILIRDAHAFEDDIRRPAAYDVAIPLVVA